MKRVLICGLAVVVAVGGILVWKKPNLFGVSFSTLERRIGIESHEEELTVNSDTQLYRNGVTITTVGRVTGLNTKEPTTLPVGLPKDPKEIAINFQNLASFNGEKAELVNGSFAEHLPCETVIRIKTDSKIKNIGFTCYAPEKYDSLESDIQNKDESLIGNEIIKDVLSTDSVLVIPVHVGAEEGISAIYWTDSSGKFNSIPLHFAAYEGNVSDDKGHPVENIDVESNRSSKSKNSVVEVKNYEKVQDAPVVTDKKTGEDISSEMGK